MNVDFADEEMIAYRESLIEKKKEQPFWKKKCLCGGNDIWRYWRSYCTAWERSDDTGGSWRGFKMPWLLSGMLYDSCNVI